MEAETIWGAVLGWAAGSLFMWRYMLRVCDQEHAEVLRLRAMMVDEGFEAGVERHMRKRNAEAQP